MVGVIRKPKLSDAELAAAMAAPPVALDGEELPWWVTAPLDSQQPAQNAPRTPETARHAAIGAN